MANPGMKGMTGPGARLGRPRRGKGPAFCALCGWRGDVKDTRHMYSYIRRRRRCKNNHRWSTVELAGPAGQKGSQVYSRLIKSVETLGMEKLKLQLKELLT